MNHFKNALSEAASLTDAGMERLLPLAEGLEVQVLEAMRYSCFAGGKRLRPFLVLASADLFKRFQNVLGARRCCGRNGSHLFPYSRRPTGHGR